MKKIILFLLIALFYTSIALAQAYYKTPSNIGYYKTGSGPDVVIYMDGFSSNPNPLGSSFYKSFLPSIQDNVTCYISIPFANTSWEKPWNGTLLGTDFLNFVAEQHPNARIFVTGFSGGADPGYIYGAKRITAFASVAGSDLNGYKGMMWWREQGIPVWAFIGTTDTSENSRANCEKTWISWFDPVGDLKLTYVTGGHGSVPVYAYNPANGLWAWFDSIGKQPEPPPLIDDQGKSWYYSESEKVIIFETVNGKKLRVTPD